MEGSTYKGAVCIILSDELQLLAVNLVRSNAPPALAGHYLVDMLPQSDLPSVGEHFAAFGRQVFPLIEVADLDRGDILGIAYVLPMSVPLDALQHNYRAPDPSPYLTVVSYLPLRLHLS